MPKSGIARSIILGAFRFISRVVIAV
jgi:hypothetical protein